MARKKVVERVRSSGGRGTATGLPWSGVVDVHLSAVFYVTILPGLLSTCIFIKSGLIMGADKSESMIAESKA